MSINDGEDYTAFPGLWGGRQVVCGADGFLYSLQSNTNRDLLRSTYSVDELLSMLSTSEKIAEQGVSIYPNPTNGLATVTGKNLKSAEVFNILGQRVAKVQGQGETMQIDIAKLPAGVYFVNIMDEEGRKCVRKVVKE